MLTPKRRKMVATIFELGDGCTLRAVHERMKEDCSSISVVWNHVQQLQLLGLVKPRLERKHRDLTLSEKGIEVAKQMAA